ncbi:hypothetical protein GOBAR_DD01218 [Gossypium barbadense]|nr:hypothetical protein GOBAR_DD01218 [Gossypium barbadense]
MEAFGEWKLVIRRSRNLVESLPPEMGQRNRWVFKDHALMCCTNFRIKIPLKIKLQIIQNQLMLRAKGFLFMTTHWELMRRPNIIMGSSSKGGNKSEDLVGDLSLIHVGLSSSNLSIDKTLSAQVTSQNFNNMLVRGKHISMVKRVPKTLLDAAFHSVVSFVENFDPNIMSDATPNLLLP